MNYPQSQEILEEIDRAKKILINLHRGPDLDSFACAFSLYYFLCSLGKDVDVVLTNTSEISGQLLKMEETSLVKKVDFARIDFKKYDLFISPDSGSWQQIVDNPSVTVPSIPIIVIDHHESNEKFGKINLVDKDAASCAQIIYSLFKDWDFFVDTKTANLLMIGIVSDSGGFAFSNDPKVMKVAGELLELGADKVKIINDIFRTKKFQEVKIWGEFLTRFQLDKENKFVWAALSYDDYKMFGKPPSVLSAVATMFASIIDETNFGIVMLEKKPKVMHIALRSRSTFDVSKIAEKLNGGGHKATSGASVLDLKFDEAVEKVLETARNYAKENS